MIKIRQTSQGTKWFPQSVPILEVLLYCSEYKLLSIPTVLTPRSCILTCFCHLRMSMLGEIWQWKSQFKTLAVLMAMRWVWYTLLKIDTAYTTMCVFVCVCVCVCVCNVCVLGCVCTCNVCWGVCYRWHRCICRGPILKLLPLLQ